MDLAYFSIRMHASRQGTHISGAERIVPSDKLATVSATLTRRALQHSKGAPDDIRIAMELLDPGTIVYLSLPDITTVQVVDVANGRQAALAELCRAGVDATAARQAMATLAAGVALRGAMLIDAVSGERLEVDRERGVRASRMDLTSSAEQQLRNQLAEHGLDNPHVREALVLAAKVRALPGFVAELCWSDDPDYSAGYVCSRERGYVRFPWLKPLGMPFGGRVFFVSAAQFELAAAYVWLERTPVLCDRPGTIHPDERWPA